MVSIITGYSVLIDLVCGLTHVYGSLARLSLERTLEAGVEVLDDFNSREIPTGRQLSICTRPGLELLTSARSRLS